VELSDLAVTQGRHLFIPDESELCHNASFVVPGGQLRVTPRPSELQALQQVSREPDHWDTRTAAMCQKRSFVLWVVIEWRHGVDLPIEQNTKLVINIKTAKALSLTVPPSLLACADEVIE